MFGNCAISWDMEDCTTILIIPSWACDSCSLPQAKHVVFKYSQATHVDAGFVLVFDSLSTRGSCYLLLSPSCDRCSTFMYLAVWLKKGSFHGYSGLCNICEGPVWKHGYAADALSGRNLVFHVWQFLALICAWINELIWWLATDENDGWIFITISDLLSIIWEYRLDLVDTASVSSGAYFGSGLNESSSLPCKAIIPRNPDSSGEESRASRSRLRDNVKFDHSGWVRSYYHTMGQSTALLQVVQSCWWSHRSEVWWSRYWVGLWAERGTETLSLISCRAAPNFTRISSQLRRYVTWSLST